MTLSYPNYPIIITPLSDEDGGGFLGVAPDLLGCTSDGETYAEALSNTLEAIGEWMDEAARRGLQIPEPNSFTEQRREERQALVEALKSAVTGVDHIESRIEELEATIRDVEEKIEHAESWVRFDNIVGRPDREPIRSLRC